MDDFMKDFIYTEIPMGYFDTVNKVKLGLDNTWPIENQPEQQTMNKKLIINVAPVGALITRKQNPTQPQTPKEIADETIAAYKAGASMFHIHCRKDGVHAVDPEIYKETEDLVFAGAPDIITNLCMISINHQEGREKRTKPIIEPLLAYGQKYSQIAIINPLSFTHGQTSPFIATLVGAMDETAYLESVGVKPFLACGSPQAIGEVIENICDTGIAKPPYYIGIACGIHGTIPSYPDPEGYYNVLQNVKAIPKDKPIVWELSAGGRNWLPMAVFAIMLGCDIIRVGKEDQLHKFPFGNEVITSCAEQVTMIANIARSLGREIATPAEAREILGLPKFEG